VDERSPVRGAPLGPLYVVTRRFDPSRGEDWTRYVAWSGLRQLREVVTLDAMLCERVVAGPIAADWPHIVNEDFMLDYFVDLPHLLGRAGSLEGRNLLCVFRNPPEPPDAPAGFRFAGYDLVDERGGVSALVNCGGFPEAFSNDELSPLGLVESHARAFEIRVSLREKYPRGEHSSCHVFAIFRREQA
jgi:hypothetical protein